MKSSAQIKHPRCVLLGATWLAAAAMLVSCDAGFAEGMPTTSTTVPPTTSTTVSQQPTTTVVEDAVVVVPGDDLQSMVYQHPSGTTFLLKAGTHRGLSIIPKDGNTFVGENGAVMDGQGNTDYAFIGDAKNVTIRGLIIQNYDTPAQRGAIDSYTGSSWKVIDNEIRYNAGVGVSLNESFVIDGNYIHHNEQMGVKGWGSNGKVTNNEIAYNNYNNRYEMAWEAGGTKFVKTTNLYVAYNYVHDNHGPGLWTDHLNYNTVYEYNTVKNNYGPGIFHEISYDAVIRNNTVTGNAHSFYVGGIVISSSSNVEVSGNTLSGNNGGIIGIQDDRGGGNRGPFETTGLNVHHNQVTWTTGYHGTQVNSGTNVTQTGTILYDHNTYNATAQSPFRWGPRSASLTWTQWQNLGFDTNGTLQETR